MELLDIKQELEPQLELDRATFQVIDSETVKGMACDVGLYTSTWQEPPPLIEISTFVSCPFVGLNCGTEPHR